ncbi:hypothetical protein HDU87_003644 [Geranomyces variabilis]|uniref:Uncharacterized protein n=1 Tax=Geranomyces variabilis TaxID=109894 RepID=A0AAD5TJF7_9FUNG|nr:hypothetical protein HDU87_003644 [Geranomyces variabilis]
MEGEEDLDGHIAIDVPPTHHVYTPGPGPFRSRRSSRIPSLSGRTSQDEPLVCARVFRTGATQIQVVDTPSDLPSEREKPHSNDGGDVEFCVMGSREHVLALKRKVQELADAARTLEAEKDRARQREEEIADELRSKEGELRRFETMHSGTDGSTLSGGPREHPTVKTFGPIDMEIITESEAGDGDNGGFRQIFWKKPRIRQYIIRHTTLIREAEERTTTWLELFFDLLFAGIVAVLGNAYISAQLSFSLEQFAILFLMSIKPWVDYVMHQNIFASEDVAQRGFTVWIMALVVGLGVNCVNGFSSTHSIFAVFYLLIRFSFAAAYLSYWPLFANFRSSLAQAAIPAAMSAPLYIVSIFYPEHKYVLWWSGIAIDYLLSPCLTLLTRYVDFMPRPVYRLAISIEHLSERNGLFFIIVLAEVMVALFYNSVSSTPDVSYAKAVVGLCLALSLAWLYFDVDGSQQEIHAMRRKAYTGVIWNLAHIPLYGSIVLAGVSLEVMVQATDESGDHAGSSSGAAGNSHAFTIRTYASFFGSLSCVLTCYTIISLTHRSMHAARISKRLRTGTRMAVAICFAALAGAARNAHAPLLSSARCIALAAGALLLLVSLETWSRLGGATRHGETHAELPIDSKKVGPDEGLGVQA